MANSQAQQEIRRHVKRLVDGTPLLLRTESASGQEELQICSFSVTEDFSTLRWCDQEGTGATHQVPLKMIASVEEDHSSNSAEEGHYALILKLHRSATSSGPPFLELICSSPEDLEAWRDGLKFLVQVVSAGTPAKRLSPSAMSRAQAGADAAVTAAGAALDDELRRRLSLQEQLCERLEQENQMLREIVKRKDATIQELSQKNSAVERMSKTESTSRESDAHLQEREVTILRRKNTRLQKDLKAKQKTVKELLALVGRLTQQQGAESSAQETETQDDFREGSRDEESEDDDVQNNIPAVTTRPASAPATAAPAAATTARAAAAAERRATAEASAADAQALAAREAAASLANPALDSLAAVFGEPLASLTGKLEMLEKAAAAATQTAANKKFQPPPRASAAKQVQGGRPETNNALEALAKELALLEEKKRVVERLARTLEPDDDEDDGFPLR
eukprot:TRINITY_DN27215_c0_g1_i1.p1 TRINITY_DN27215_c0_g1~~TRINITY_DN27215_c0_g1_i1.p1  ORF type:complete len:452 (+),score=127.24 TRINITY_DN27215_c0_g1_i1:25-1380(+)